MTVHDLEALPDDGHRYELVDGSLIVAPGPELVHQTVQSNLMRLLFADCPEELFVYGAPTDVVLADDTVLQPDLLVVRKADRSGRRLTAVPQLVVEILSPSTRLIDLNLKFARLERAGVASYWVIDPSGHVTLNAWRLRDDRYQSVASVTGAQPWSAEEPYPVTIVPAALRD
ncbi:Uma2 family endonuclease [Nocardioides pelophilus]|uniref:Uma2 family endonuclease n=1 Tax=Nocardioides pelophilus TaxID=2172019 RepID=UPI001FEC5E85|nr:Uma2 family endonuclease [Nocardioides pelophilus]